MKRKTQRTHSNAAGPPAGVRRIAVAAAITAITLAGTASASAQQILSPGDAVVTGFSGVAPSPSGSGLKINLSGPSAQILSLAAMPGGPSGTLIAAPAKRQITAGEVGQVFAIAFDAEGNVYLGATSAFGLSIVEQSGAERLETGEAGAKFMDGQFGKGGSPGSIWRVDARTGEVTEFATLPDNAGPGIGDIVFDTTSRQFFVSDLDTGLIHRLSEDGTLIDTFDHGVDGITAAGGEAVADDETRLDITNATFDSMAPTTWGFTPSERRVWGLAFNAGRLYYAVAGSKEVWSIGIGDDGTFVGDGRREIEVTGLAGDGPITDMLFDASGRIYLAQRAPAKSSFNYSELAKPTEGTVVRYRRLEDGTGWEIDPESYAIGMPEPHNAANGGIALGYAYSARGAARLSKCGGMLWSTGERLVSSDPSGSGAPDVHGLQGNSVSDVHPDNTPPVKSYFVDYDGLLGDSSSAGHLGDVEVFAPCQPEEATYVPENPKLPPGFVPPGTSFPPEFPPEFPPPVIDFNTNLRLIKRTTTPTCLPAGAGWHCGFRVRVTNMGPDNYFGDIQVRDTLPANPAGAFFGVGPVPPWACWMGGPGSLQCWRPNVFLVPGQSVSLNVNVWLPNTYDRCRLRNLAEIVWAPGGTRWNTDPTDDRDGASARVPLPQCEPIHRPIGSVIHRPLGSVIHRPRGSDVHRPRGSVIHRPRGSDVHRPRGSVIHRPRGSDVHRPRGSVIHRPRGSDVHRPRGSVIHRPRGSDVHRPRGSVIHRPRGSVIHRPRGSVIHRPRGSVIHRPRGSVIHRPRGSVIHRPRGSRVHRPRGSRVHRPHGSRIHRPRGSNVHRPRSPRADRRSEARIEPRRVIRRVMPRHIR